MSYDVRFEIDGETASMDEPKDLRGGTYAVGGTSEAWLNITYNYGGIFAKLFDGGLRSLYGRSAAELRTALSEAIARVDALDVVEEPCGCCPSTREGAAIPKYRLDYYHEPSLDCYWAVTKANARRALENLRTIAEHVPDDAVLSGD